MQNLYFCRSVVERPLANTKPKLDMWGNVHLITDWFRDRVHSSVRVVAFRHLPTRLVRGPRLPYKRDCVTDYCRAYVEPAGP